MTGMMNTARASMAIALLGAASLAQAAPAEAVQRDLAGNRLEPLTEQPGPAAADSAGAASVWYCTADRHWCLRTAREGEQGPSHLEVAEQVAGESEPRFRHVPLEQGDNERNYQPWRYILRMAPGIGAPRQPRDPQQAARENVLVGALGEWNTMYSGGGASASRLVISRIYHEDDGIQIDPVLELPSDGNAMIRACFSEQDTAQRAGACHDEYSFSADLRLDPAGTHMPLLRYSTTATRYPAGVSRARDSLAMGQLTRSDLRTETDRTCSFERQLRLVDGSYQLDAPLPQCSEFTEL